MDTQVGKIFDKLTELELWDNTIVIFASDHGYHLGEHAWWNKVTVFEQGARAPFIAWVPGKTSPGTRTSSLIEFVDLYPTLAELCGLNPPHALDGKSFAPILNNPNHPGKTAAYTQVVRGQLMGRSVRTEQWRYTEWDFGREGIELYAHPQDPKEYHNLANKADLAGIQQKLKALLDKNFTAK
ncbi:MAG: sulfatase-like hydrolase/transferase [Verrucomicrobia bacterium]|nr:sulfatase-like hydrolase/transferase [Verrucomicrobiota bacterium]